MVASSKGISTNSGQSFRSKLSNLFVLVSMLNFLLTYRYLWHK
jgi:hypothetical protein